MEFSDREIAQFRQWAKDRAQRDAELRWPPGREREEAALRLESRYYAQYAQPEPPQ